MTNKFDSTLAPAEPQQRQRRDRVVNANNDDSRVEIALIILAVLFLCSCVLGVAGGRLAGLGYAWQAVLSVIPMIPLAIWAMPFITGHAPAFFEVWQGERTEREWASVESKRVEAVRDVALAESDIRLEQIRTEQLRIEADATMNRLHRRMAQIESAIDAAKEIDAGPDRTDNYVDNQPQPARVAVRDFVASCYGVDGFDPDFAYDNGGLVRAPWNNLWRAEPWRNEAKQIMWDSVLEGQPNQPRLKYSNNNDAQRAIDRS